MSEMPMVSLSVLAKAMGAMSPSGLARLLKPFKSRASSEGPRRSYQLARKQAIDCLVDGKPLDPDAPLRSHEREAVRALSRVWLDVPSHVRARRAPSGVARWVVNGVVVSMTPDVELVGRVSSGAAKFTFTKEPLSRGVGSDMAALMWHWQANVLELVSVDPSCCIIYEPSRSGSTQRSSSRPTCESSWGAV